jgi:Tol biopolymer transport system component
MAKYQPRDNKDALVRPGIGGIGADGNNETYNLTKEFYSRLAFSPRSDRFITERFYITDNQPFSMFITSAEGKELKQVLPPLAFSGRTSPQPDWSSTNRLAFVASRSNCMFPCQTNIFLSRLDANPRRLTYRGGSTPSWSPYASQVAFTRKSSNGLNIYLIKKDGRGLRRLTYRGGYSPTWSPDGKWIAFYRAADLYIVRTDGSRLRRLVKGAAAGLDPASAEAVSWQALSK